MKKIISLVLLTSVLAGTALMVPQKAQAADPITWAVCGAYEATIGKLFGAAEDIVSGTISGAADKIVSKIASIDAVPVSDSAVQSGQKAQVASDKKTECERFVADVALGTLKKQLLNIMTQDVVEWINNGYGPEGPKFTQDFIKVFTDAGDQAVGDVLQQYAATKVLCQPFDFDITFQLQQPAPLAQRAQCTLTSVIKSFESYRDDFKNGGWIGYQELLKPQNNQWGVELLTQSEITSRTALKINSSLLKETVSIGFDSSECTGGWDLVELGTKKPADPNFVDLDPYRHIAKGSTYAGKTWDDPKVPPPSPIIGGVQTTGLEYVCAGAMVTTPGRTIAAALEKSILPEFDLIINSKDLTNSLAIIADAAINDIIKRGVKGIQNFNKPVPKNPENEKFSNSQRNRVNQASGDYDKIQGQISNSKTTGAYLDQINPAANTILAASSILKNASDKNKEAIKTGQDTLACIAQSNTHADRPAIQAAVDKANLNPALITAKSTEIKTNSASIQTLISQINAGNCDTYYQPQSCQSQIDGKRSAAGQLNIDANNLLNSVQGTLTNLEELKKKVCP
ncbi:MAG: hypothetical protein AAB700_00725 [Patescibacteria group bacterium]